MASYVKTLALFASVAATAASNTTCPSSTVTYPTTINDAYSSYITPTTVTIAPSTRSVNDASYVFGSSIFQGNATTLTHYVPTSTSTAYELSTTVTSETCSSTVTVLAVSTSTSYTGTYTPSPIGTYCGIDRTTETIYASGTTTVTRTATSSPIVTVTGTKTYTTDDYYYGTTVTVTSSNGYDLVFVTTGTATETQGVECLSTSYTSTSTPDAIPTLNVRCAPENLYAGFSNTGNPDVLDVQNFRGEDGPYRRDASDCCQGCLDTEGCVASSFYPGGYGCEFWFDRDGACARSIQVGGQGVNNSYNAIAAPGCGYVVT